LLRARLVRRGLGPAAVLVATAWPPATASACLPATLVSGTVKAAGLFAAGQAATQTVGSAKVAGLVEGAMKTMSLTKLKAAMAVLLVLGMIGFGGGLVAYHTASAQQGPAQKFSGGNTSDDAEHQKVDAPRKDGDAPQENKPDLGKPIRSLP